MEFLLAKIYFSLRTYIFAHEIDIVGKVRFLPTKEKFVGTNVFTEEKCFVSIYSFRR